MVRKLQPWRNIKPTPSHLLLLVNLTSVEAGLHEHADGLDAQLKVVGGDVGSVAHDEGQRLHALDEGLGVVLAQVLAQGQAVLGELAPLGGG